MLESKASFEVVHYILRTTNPIGNNDVTTAGKCFIDGQAPGFPRSPGWQTKDIRNPIPNGHFGLVLKPDEMDVGMSLKSLLQFVFESARSHINQMGLGMKRRKGFRQLKRLFFGFQFSRKKEDGGLWSQCPSLVEFAVLPFRRSSSSFMKNSLSTACGA